MNKKIAALLAALATTGLTGCGDKPPPAAAAQSKPALTVTVTTPQLRDWPQTLSASGNVAAWQEAVIGPEISNYRITEVRANVGDMVKQGDVLARIASDAVDSELAESKAAVAEAEATLAEARANQRTRPAVARKRFLQRAAGHPDADCRRNRAGPPERRQGPAEVGRTAALQGERDGTRRRHHLGAQRHRRLADAIRRGTVPPDSRRPAGMARRGHRRRTGPPPARPAGPRWKARTAIAVSGTVRTVAPTVDPQTRNGIVYVDLPPEAAKALSAGMFTRGEFQLGQRPALTLPQSAVLLREGFAYVFRIEQGPDNTAKVIQTKVGTGRRDGEQHIEVTGLDPTAQVVASGAGFLADGDTVRIVAAQSAVKAQP